MSSVSYRASAAVVRSGHARLVRMPVGLRGHAFVPSETAVSSLRPCPRGRLIDNVSRRSLDLIEQLPEVGTRRYLTLLERRWIATSRVRGLGMLAVAERGAVAYATSVPGPVDH